MNKLLPLTLLLFGCGTAPMRPMPAELDASSDESAEPDYLAPDNPLTHDIVDPEIDEGAAPEDPHENHRGHGVPEAKPESANEPTEVSK